MWDIVVLSHIHIIKLIVQDDAAGDSAETFEEDALFAVLHTAECAVCIKIERLAAGDAAKTCAVCRCLIVSGLTGGGELADCHRLTGMLHIARAAAPVIHMLVFHICEAAAEFLDRILFLDDVKQTAVFVQPEEDLVCSVIFRILCPEEHEIFVGNMEDADRVDKIIVRVRFRIQHTANLFSRRIHFSAGHGNEIGCQDIFAVGEESLIRQTGAVYAVGERFSAAAVRCKPIPLIAEENIIIVIIAEEEHAVAGVIHARRTNRAGSAE